MTDICYDTEFVEIPGQPVRLLSLGAICGTVERYMISSSQVAMNAAVNHPWVRDNVLPYLPVTLYAMPGGKWQWEWNTTHPDFALVMPEPEIANTWWRFVTMWDQPRLWAWYGAYDHVVTSQLFGPMAALPVGMPMHTCDLKQLAEDCGNPALPDVPGQSHRAIDDAREVKVRLDWLHRNYDLCRRYNPGAPAPLRAGDDGRTLWRVGAECPDELVGMVDTTQLADRIVSAVNRAGEGDGDGGG